MLPLNLFSEETTFQVKFIYILQSSILAWTESRYVRIRNASATTKMAHSGVNVSDNLNYNNYNVYDVSWF